VDEARRVGVRLRLVGRRRDALESLARDGEEVRVADARDEDELRNAFDGCFAVASLAGPFLAVGYAPVAAAIAAGAHYLDTTGEQAFARGVYEEWGPRAAERGVVLLTAFGFDYVPGDLAARLAAEGIEPVHELVVAYSVNNVATSRGTRRTVGHVMGQSQVAWEDGRLVESRFGATTRRVRFPFGDRDVVEWGGTEPLTVPRHTQVRGVRSYIRAPRAAARAGLASRLAAPFVRLTSRFGPLGPSPEQRAASRFAVVAEAHGTGAQRAAVVGSDPYGLTARLIVTAAELLRAEEARGAGALAPAEAFDARRLAARLDPLLRIESVEPIP
jgi:short subunit dehydrogenase-like uncharacterized protein